MACFEVANVSISGVSACVPSTVEDNLTLEMFQGEDATKFVASTGVRYRRIADAKTTASDLCFHAAEQLIKDLNWQKEEIDCILFVSQTADYITPATSCVLQYRLGLSTECHAYDISSGCSGWIYGLSSISSLMQNGGFRKALLLVGDTSLKICSSIDRSTWPLFGDAGTATALEYNQNSPAFKFHTATDGSGMEAIMIPDGGFRNPFTQQSLVLEKNEEGIERNRLHTILNGMDVFSFGITNVPISIHRLASHFKFELSEIDVFAFHQANRFMLEKIRKKIGIDLAKVPYSLENFGNTSSATIPLTLVTERSSELRHSKLKIVASGFGVGLSWGSVYFETDKIVCSKLIEL